MRKDKQLARESLLNSDTAIVVCDSNHISAFPVA